MSGGLRTLLIVVLGSTVAASACNTRDPACFCIRALQGSWLANSTTIRPLCRKTVSFKGLQRPIDIYLPQELKPEQQARYTPWIYLHGVHAAHWYIADNPVWENLSKTCQIPLGGNAQVSDMNVISGSPILSPCSSNTSSTNSSSNNKQQGHLRLDDALLVVPHATGTVQRGQVWNSRFWKCVGSLSYCVDDTVDDVNFVAHLVQNLQKILLPGLFLNKPYLSGYSNGGMLVQTLLCQQPSIVQHLSGVGVLASALGSSFAGKQCQQQLSASVSFLWVHGTADGVIPYEAGKSEGVDLMGVEAVVKMWAARLGCSADSVNKPRTIFQDFKARVTCVDYCAMPQQQQQQQQQTSSRQQQGTKQQRPSVVLCSISAGSHFLTRDVPADGYAAGLLRWGIRRFEGQPTAFS